MDLYLIFMGVVGMVFLFFVMVKKAGNKLSLKDKILLGKKYETFITSHDKNEKASRLTFD